MLSCVVAAGLSTFPGLELRGLVNFGKIERGATTWARGGEGAGVVELIRSSVRVSGCGTKDSRTVPPFAGMIGRNILRVLFQHDPEHRCVMHVAEGRELLARCHGLNYSTRCAGEGCGASSAAWDLCRLTVTKSCLCIETKGSRQLGLMELDT